MRIHGAKRTKYKVFIYNDMGNAVEQFGYKTMEELDRAINGGQFSDKPFKAYVGGCIYCRHIAWNDAPAYQQLCRDAGTYGDIGR